MGPVQRMQRLNPCSRFFLVMFKENVYIKNILENCDAIFLTISLLQGKRGQMEFIKKLYIDRVE